MCCTSAVLEKSIRNHEHKIITHQKMATLNEGEHLFAISLCQASMSILFILIESSTPVAFLVVCLCPVSWEDC